MLQQKTENPVIMQIHAHVHILAIYVQACTNKNIKHPYPIHCQQYGKPPKTGAKISLWAISSECQLNAILVKILNVMCKI